MASDIENYDWLGLLKSVVDVGKNGLLNEESAQERWDHCLSCIYLKDNGQCKKCGCLMNKKVRVKGAKCPIGIW